MCSGLRLCRTILWIARCRLLPVWFSALWCLVGCGVWSYQAGLIAAPKEPGNLESTDPIQCTTGLNRIRRIPVCGSAPTREKGRIEPTTTRSRAERNGEEAQARVGTDRIPIAKLAKSDLFGLRICLKMETRSQELQRLAQLEQARLEALEASVARRTRSHQVVVHPQPTSVASESLTSLGDSVPNSETSSWGYGICPGCDQWGPAPQFCSDCDYKEMFQPTKPRTHHSDVSVDSSHFPSDIDVDTEMSDSANSEDAESAMSY
jgi:hypothetical protein